jgi:ParB family chromosome partitioning protein
MPRNALGRGLSALIREPEEEKPLPQAPPQESKIPQVEKSLQEAPPHLSQMPQVPAPVGMPASIASAAGAAAAGAPALTEGLIQIDIDLIDPSPYQPRTTFREQALDELSRSIQSSGIIQPIVVRRTGLRYQLIAGERRWRAAQLAGLQRVPAILRSVPDELALEMTLVENLQREDLNPIEQARAFQRLSEEFGLTQEEVAERTGKDRATVANAVRLLRLEEFIQDLLEEGRISAGHGRALLAIPETKARMDLARRIARGGLTVRQVERLAARGSRQRPELSPVAVDPNTRAALEELQRKFGTRVELRPLRPGRPGQLAFEYYDAGDLTRLYDQLMGQ